MEDQKIVDYINILLRSNIAHEHLLLMVYDLLHAKYATQPLSDMDTLRQEDEIPIAQEEFEVPVPRVKFKALPADIVFSYSESVSKQ